MQQKNLCFFKGLLLALGCVTLLVTGRVTAQDTQPCRRHFLLLYDRSGPFWKSEFSPFRQQLEQTLLSLFSNNKTPQQAQGSWQNLQQEQLAGIPFFDSSRDEISCFYFGINEEDRKFIGKNRNHLKQANRLYSTFSQQFVQPFPSTWQSSDFNLPQDFIQHFFQSRRPYWGSGITLSHLAYPVVFDRLAHSCFAEEYIVLIASDFLSGNTFGNKQDLLRVREMLHFDQSYFQVILDSIQLAKNSLYTIPYFDFEYHTGRKDYSDQPIIFGVNAFKVHPFAGFPQPEYAPIKWTSIPTLRQQSYEGSSFSLNGIDLDFGHNQRVTIQNLSVLLHGDPSDRKDTLFQSISSPEIAPFDENHLSAIQYSIPKTTIPLAPDILSANIKINFHGIFNLRPGLSVPWSWPTSMSIPEDKIMLASALPMVVLNYLLPGLALLGLLWWLIRKSRPTDMVFYQDGFADSFEQTDYNTFGRRKTPYLDWGGDRTKIHATGYLHYQRFSPIKRSSTIFIDLAIQACPQGFELYMEDEEGTQFYPGYNIVFTPGRYEKKQSFRFWVVLKQVHEELEIGQTQFVQYKLTVRAYQNGFLGHEINTIYPYAFQFGPSLGEVWLGIDPGTTGTCLVSATHANNMAMEQDDGQDKITPSIIAFENTKSPTSTTTLRSGLHYRVGDSANAVKALERFTSFQSIKKLLGYKNKLTVPFKNGNIDFLGTQLTSLIAKELILEHGLFLQKNADRFSDLLDEGKYTPKRVSAAIPNNFTAAKTEALINSLAALNQFREIRCIPEAEAVLIHYLFSEHRTHSQKAETVLIFDMGGATINVSAVEIIQKQTNEGQQYHLNILGKLGYGIGGDTIDYCIIKLLFEHTGDYPALTEFDPFVAVTGLPENLRQKQLHLRKRFAEIALALKKKIIQRFGKYDRESLLEAIDVQDALSDHLNIAIRFSDTDKFMKLFQRNERMEYPLFEHSIFQELIYQNVTSSVVDLGQICNQFKPDSLIFSGRSTRFPLIEETVKKTLKNQPLIIQLSDQERKSAVARGACLYGINRNAIQLSYLKANSYFGILMSPEAGKFSLISLIDIQDEFQTYGQSRRIQGSKQIKDRFPLDNHRVNFLQIMGSDPEGILQRNERHKFSLLEKIKVESRTQEISMTVEENDTVHCRVLETNGKIHKRIAKVNDQDLADANDEHYTWLLY